MSSKAAKSNAERTERLKSVADLVEIAGRLKASTVVVAGGDRIGDLHLVESARDHGIIDRIILVGQEDRIKRAIAEVDIQVPGKDIVAAENDEAVAAATVKLIKAGGINVVLKGNISTPTLNRHMRPLAIRSTVSLVTIFDAAPIAQGRPMVLTDAGFTTVCNFGRMADLVRNAVDVARIVMGIDRPRVAILSANEKQIASLPSTWMGLELANRNWPDAVICGPLSFDLATDSGSVAMKGLPDLPGASEVAGQADVLVCPGIDTANALYKTISALNKYGQASLAGIAVGFPVPYIILSRADTLETRLESVALCSIYAQRTLRRRAEKPPRAATPAAKTYRVLAFNPGSTSQKVALYQNDRCIHETEVAYLVPPTGNPAERVKVIADLTRLVHQVLDQWGGKNLDAVSARGGFMPRPDGKLSAGTYLIAKRKGGRIAVDEDIVSAVLNYPEKDHASNFGIPVAAALAREIKVPAFTVDPVVVDEFIPEAEISGYAGIVRRSTAHALNIRSAARGAAREIGRPLEDINLVVAHLGGGITIAAIRQGKIIDNTIALLGGGPFTPQRAGQLPLDELLGMCYSGRFNHDELLVELTKRGGVQSYLGEHRMEKIERRIGGGDKQAELVVDAMVYQIAKGIGEMFVAAGCDVEAIVLTGGLVQSKLIRAAVRRRVRHLAPVMVFEGSLEMAALAAGAIAVLSGREAPRRYRLPKRVSQPGDKNK